MTSSDAALSRLIGMVHLPPLPGSPGYGGSMSTVVESAVRDATTLADAGFDALCVENFGDAPFFADEVPKATVAAMTATVAAVSREVDLPTMVNVLRNDGLAALAVAAATGAAMIRVNVLSGAMWTDQGLIQGRAAEIGRTRSEIAPSVRVLADVFVKHATPPPGTDLTQATVDLVERSGADAVITSGAGTGDAPDIETVKTVRAAARDAPLYIGSGATAATVASLLEIADGVIVGTALKVDGQTTQPVDLATARAFVTAARG